MSAIAVVLVDDHRVVTRSLRAYLESFPDIQVIATAGSGEEFLAQLPSLRPDVVLQDLLLPGGIDGIETTRRALAISPGLHVVALTASIDEARMMGVLRAGAIGYVRKDAEPEILLAAVRAAARGKPFIDPGVSRHIIQAGQTRDDLTRRELDVLRQLALGKSNRDVAAALDLSEETVKTHVGNVLGKLQVENRAQAIVQALKRGLVTLDELD
jgi:DNA-binding NarL/FixJ family response regulator